MGYDDMRNAERALTGLESAQCSDRHTLHSGIDEISKRLIRIASRVETLVGKVEGGGKTSPVSKPPVGINLRDRLNAFFPILNEIEAALSRLDRNYCLIEEALRNERDEIALVIEGEADGADRMGRMAATLLHIPLARFPAKWHEYGRAAGPIRNEEMLQKLLTYDADREVWAFHKNIEASKGTLDMVTRAANVGVIVRLYDGDTLEWKKWHLSN